MSAPSLDELAEQLRRRLAGTFSVDPPEFGRIDLCSETNGLELEASLEDSRIRLTTTLYVLAPSPGIGLDSRSGDQPPADVLRSTYVEVIEQLHAASWKQADWALTATGSWFTASSEPDIPDDLLGYELTIERTLDDLDATCEAITWADAHETWKLLG